MLLKQSSKYAPLRFYNRQRPQSPKPHLADHRAMEEQRPIQSLSLRGALSARAFAALGLLAILLWHTAQPHAIGPRGMADSPVASGGSKSTPMMPAAPNHLRIATYNIHGGVGQDNRFDLDRLARNMQGLDFIALNEVHGSAWGQDNNQAADLGHRSNQAWLFAPAVQSWNLALFGNGLVTRLPIAAWRSIPLDPRPGHGQRNAVVVTIPYGSRTVQIVLTHIVRSTIEPREAQLAEVIDLFLAQPSPAILVGDLNSRSDSPTLARLLARTDVTDAIGQATHDKHSARIDWIIIRGLRCLSGGMRDNDASDHPLYWAELE